MFWLAAAFLKWLCQADPADVDILRVVARFLEAVEKFYRQAYEELEGFNVEMHLVKEITANWPEPTENDECKKLWQRIRSF